MVIPRDGKFAADQDAHAARVSASRMDPSFGELAFAPSRSRTTSEAEVSARRRCNGCEATARLSNRHARARALPGKAAFTLIELLVVITIIVVLMGLLFPAFRGVQDQAKRTQAKNDLTQIVTAVNAFYTEYGKYPLPAGTTADFPYGPGGTTNATLFDELRGTSVTTLNPKQIVFISPPDVKDPAHPRSGIGTSMGIGQFFDPWGNPYAIKIDGDYDNQINPNPYSANAGSSPLRQGIIAWSLGKDQAGGSGDKKLDTAEDDVISWQ